MFKNDNMHIQKSIVFSLGYGKLKLGRKTYFSMENARDTNFFTKSFINY